MRSQRRPDRLHVLIGRVVGVAARIKGVEGSPVVVVEGKAELDALGQIGFAMKWRPNAIMLASPLATVAS